MTSLKQIREGSSTNSFNNDVLKLILFRLPLERKNPSLNSSSGLSLSHGCRRVESLRLIKSLKNIICFLFTFSQFRSQEIDGSFAITKVELGFDVIDFRGTDDKELDLADLALEKLLKAARSFLNLLIGLKNIFR